MNNVYPFADRETIEAEARQWLIRLDGDATLSPEDIAALREWSDRSPTHREELQRISAFWDDANILTELAIPLSKQSRRPEGLFSTLAAVLKQPQSIIAASILGIAVVLTLWIYPQPHETANGIYGTAIGEQKITQLPDGSTIHLNTDSQVQVDYSATTRKLRLLRGEAHFQVAKDPGRHFEVHVAKSLIQAVGTAFSVQMRDDAMRVIVTEGKVELATQINAPGTELADSLNNSPNHTTLESNTMQPKLVRIGTLSSGQSTTYDSAIRIEQDNFPAKTVVADIHVETIAEEDLKKQLAWRNGYLVFKGDTLTDVINEVSRYTPVTIEITDLALGQIPIGGRFKVGDMEALYEVLEVSFGIQVAQLDDQHIQLKPSSD